MYAIRSYYDPAEAVRLQGEEEVGLVLGLVGGAEQTASARRFPTDDRVMPGRHPLGAELVRRITSYNVCYTKLLRVPHARYRLTPRPSISFRKSRKAATESRNSRSPIPPVSRRDFPRPVIRLLRTTGRKSLPSWAATSIRTVLVPMSIAAKRLIRSYTRLPFGRNELFLPLQYPDDAGTSYNFV